MLFTEFPIGWLATCVFLAVFCGGAVVWCVQLAKYCRAAVEFVQSQNKNAVSLRKMAEVEATLTELLDSYESLLASHRKLRARIGMRKAREKPENAPELATVPGTDAEKAEYKRQLRAKLQKEGRL